MRTLLTTALVALSLFVGCGGGSGAETTERPGPPQEPREVRVSLNRYVGPEHAGFLMAEANGYFADAGLTVALDSPASPKWPLRYLLSKLVDAEFAISHEPQVAISIAKGFPVVAVGSLIPRSTAAFIWLKGSGIRSVSELKGKTIAVPGLPFQVSLLENLLAQFGLEPEDVQVKQVGYEAVQALTTGRADAIFGATSQLEGVQLRSLGQKPVVTPVRSMGIPPYDELVLMTRTGLISKDPNLIRDFMAALSRGTAAAMRNPEGVVREIESHLEPSPISNRRTREAEVAAFLPLLSKTNYMDPAQAGELLEWMHEKKMISRPLQVSELLTNDYVERP